MQCNGKLGLDVAWFILSNPRSVLITSIVNSIHHLFYKPRHLVTRYITEIAEFQSRCEMMDQDFSEHLTCQIL